MSHGKQFTLFTHKAGPNGWKVAIVLEELGLSYEPVYLDFQKGDQKAETHTKYNPNGRIPTLIDHKNGDFSIWESDAIILYLAAKYDPAHTISATTEAERFTELQWLFFQSSGQGPYFGQAAWFNFFHPEKIASAQERYKNEILRVLGVLDGVLATQPWLNGGRCTISDLSFIPWNDFAIKGLLEGVNVAEKFPNVQRWHGTMAERPSVVKIHADQIAIKNA
ncbi:glutathione S-transferase [Phanerochaete sordida]|uniref:glutathione transferase n=1 Tax=Phanerochaete sordida TaxID=48140 RepID=A0A9P3GL94_9APHY|nr:glutathione S-transferase [Phanerochaete sordida]